MSFPCAIIAVGYDCVTEGGYMSHCEVQRRAAKGNGSIRKRTQIINGREYTNWVGRYTVGYDPETGKQIQKTVSGKTQKEVAQKIRKITAEIDTGNYIAPCNLTLAEWLDRWQASFNVNVKPSTSYLYQRSIELYINPTLGNIRLSDLDTVTIQNLYNELLSPKNADVKPLSAKTIKNIHGILHRALQQAITCGHIRTNPTSGCVLPRIEKKEITPLDEEQIASFLKAIQGHPHEFLYKITLFTGLRQGEVLGLTWDCVDFKNGTLTVKQQLCKEQKKGGKYHLSSPKNGKVRVIKLAPSVVAMFRVQRYLQAEKRLSAAELWEEHDLVFSNKVGNFLSYRTVFDCFKRIVTKIGLPNARFHDLRHSYAVAAIMSGDDIKTVQENLGHYSAAFTLDVYGHVTKQMKQASADRMEQFIHTVSNVS